MFEKTENNRKRGRDGPLKSIKYLYSHLVCDVHNLFKQMTDGGSTLRSWHILTLIVSLVMARVGPVGAVSVHNWATFSAHVVPVTHRFDPLHFLKIYHKRFFSPKIILREINRRGATNVYLSHKKQCSSSGGGNDELKRLEGGHKKHF